MRTMHKNCQIRKPKLSMEASERLNRIDFGGCNGSMHNLQGYAKALKPGEEKCVQASCKSGMITSFVVEYDGNTSFDEQDILIRIYTDEEEIAQVDTRASNFFMIGYEGRCYSGEYTGKIVSEESNRKLLYRNIQIPFVSNYKIVVVNNSKDSICNLNLTAYYKEFSENESCGICHRLHVKDSKGTSGIWGEEIVLLDVYGSGNLHSIQMSLKNDLTRGQYMEGNIEIYIDDNEFPEYQSTGTEEFFMGGVYFANLHNSAYSGCTRTFNDGSANPQNIVSAHRVFEEDPIEWQHHLRVVWHNGQIRQGAVYGTTEYDFSFAYYVREKSQSALSAVTLTDARKRLGRLDYPDENSSLSSFWCQMKAISGEAAVASLKGPGILEKISFYFEQDILPEQFESLRIRFVIDGKEQPFIPLKLLIRAQMHAPMEVTECGGCTSLKSAFACIAIKYDETLDIYYDTCVNSELYFEYRTLKEKHADRTVIGMFEADEKGTIDFSLADGKGYIDFLTLESASSLQNSLIEINDVNGIPLITDKLNLFFQIADHGEDATVASNTSGYSKYKDKAVIYRNFDKPIFSFEHGLSGFIWKAPAAQLLVICHEEKAQHAALAADDINQISRHLNNLDLAYGSYEGRCYNPVEKDWLIMSDILPGETKTMLEDFGAGMLTGIRLGTPWEGRALHEAQMKIFTDGKLCVDTEVGRFFSARYEDPIYWNHTKNMSRLSKCETGEGQHSSMFRYCRIPYREHILFELTAPKNSKIEGFDNVYFASARNSAADFGIRNLAKMISKEISIGAGEKKEILLMEGDGLLTSLQLMAESEDKQMRNSILEIRDSAGNCLKAPLYMFFHGPVLEKGKADEQYKGVWHDAYCAQDGFYASSDIGWPRCGSFAPYRDVMYRILEKRPFVFERKLSVLLENTCSVEVKIAMDVLIRTQV